MKNLKIEQQKGSRVQITGELPWEDFKEFKSKAITKVGELISVDGFRKGKIPEDVVIKKAGESAILEEMANLAFQKLYPQIVLDNKIDAIGRPQIQITKLAQDNPLGFTIATAVMPEVKLPDYKKIASKVNKSFVKDVEVSDEDLEKTIQEVREMRAKQDLYKKMQDGTAPKSDVENDKDESPEEVQKRIDANLELPEFNDEFVASLGDFKNVEDFKAKVKENIKLEKERKSEDKNRIDIIEGIIADTKLEIPDILIESEIDQVMHRMRSDIEQMGMKLEDYLENIKKTEEDIRTEARGDAEKRAKIQLIVATIARNEKVAPDENRIKEELDVLKKQYPEAQESSARGYIENILINDEVFKMLQSQ